MCAIANHRIPMDRFGSKPEVVVALYHFRFSADKDNGTRARHLPFEPEADSDRVSLPDALRDAS